MLNAFPYKAENSYAPEIISRNVARSLYSNTQSASGGSRPYTSEVVNINTLPEGIVNPADFKRGNYYFNYVKSSVSTTSTFAPEMDFYLNGVLSTTYDVKCVVVPACIEDSQAERKPYSLCFDISYTDENNTLVKGRFDGKGIVTTNAAIRRVPAFDTYGAEKVDTIYLGRITFPICYWGTGASPNIKVMNTVSTFTSSNKRKYEQVLRIAGIILQPVSDDNNDQNATKED